MQINFTNLILHNFMSFGHAELSFNDDGFIRVTGLNENPLDNAQSNGSGKSSLWEAIVWAITGDTIRGTKNIVNFYGTDGCYVDLEFCIDHNKYQIIRSKDHAVRKTSLTIIINGEDVSGKGLRDSEKLLQQYIPDLTASLIGSVIILGQGLPQRFSSNTPSGRKEVLEKLSKSDFMIEDLKERVSNRKQFLTSEVNNHTKIDLENTAKKNLLQSQIESSKQTLESLNEEDLKNNIENFNSTITQIELTINEYTTNIQQLQEEDTTYTNASLKLKTQEAEELSQETELFRNNIQPHNDDVVSITASLSELNKQLNQMRQIKDVCPTCGQKLPDVHKPDTTEVEQSIAILSNKLSSAKQEVQILEQKHREDQENIKKKYFAESTTINDKLKDLKISIVTLKNNLNNSNTNLRKVQQELEAVTTEYTQLKTTIQYHNKLIKDNTESISIIEDQLMYNNMQKDLTQSHLEVINKFETSLKRDFRGYLLSTVINYIEERAKYYCRAIFDTENISFSLDGNNIDISYMNKPYENLSGGEKQKLDLIIQFSIRDMLSSQLNFTSNILVLDEVFDGLDGIGCNRVIDMIASVSDVKNIFIVTHRKDLSIPSDKELIVVKSSAGISEIRQ